ncbi:MAG: hypothetical protein KatS3mg118_3045 [Paracoccaceae bacterium]|nr:MAG: hypothetical protein KatS3mg118_3045 [Paracoccaceae bacterium]
MRHRTRRRLALVLLLVWLPAYVALAWWVMGSIERLPWALEIPVYLVLGLAWALPFRFVFRGVGRGAPEEEGGRGPRPRP